MTAIASNMANISTTRNERGDLEPYQPRFVMFQTDEELGQNGSAGVKVPKVEIDSNVQPIMKYDPGSPDAIQEGERTALDNTMLMFCSSMLTGGHDATQLPVVIVGGGGSGLETGRVLDYGEQPNRKMCSLYLSLMDRFGVKLDTFGDSRERLVEV